MVTHPQGLGEDEKLVVSPRRAADLLDIGITTLYQLIASGEVDSYKEGKSRKITLRSIRARVERQLVRSRAV
jgi:excisionase family DNA binding protein